MITRGLIANDRYTSLVFSSTGAIDQIVRYARDVYRSCFKPLLDRVGALLLLVLVSPLLLVTALALRASHGRGGILFLQHRPGRNEKIFTLVKFKTMHDSCDSDGKLLPDEERLTPIGRFLRRWSLDELPQLVNILKGEMSFIGPRPLLVRYLPRYSPEQRRRHLVTPGITGWAQVNGRNLTSWDERLALDLYYVDNLSLALDLKILFRTFVTVISGRGVSSGASSTMEEFMGPSV